MMIRRLLVRRRGFNKIESRVFCPCELCRLRYGRLLYSKRGGRPLGLGPPKIKAGRETTKSHSDLTIEGPQPMPEVVITDHLL